MLPRRRPAGTALAVAFACLLFLPGPAAALTPAQAIDLLNQQRQANGIGPVAASPALDDGCARHNRYMRLNGGGLTHDEDPARPGYSAAGAKLGADAAAEVLNVSGLGWDARGRNPWNGAPIHEQILFAPGSDRAGYADSDGFVCLRLQSSGRIPSGVTTHPGDGADGVPLAVTAKEAPYTPAEALGLPARTGPNLHVWRGASAPDLISAGLTGPDGPVAVRWLDADSRTPDGGTYAWGAATVVPLRALVPGGSYTLAVVFADGHRHRSSFTAARTPGAPAPGTTSSALAQGAAGRRAAPADRARRVRLSRGPQRVVLSRRGSSLRVTSTRVVGGAKTARVRFRNARNRTIRLRRARLAGVRRLRIPRGTRRVELRVPGTRTQQPMLLRLRL